MSHSHQSIARALKRTEPQDRRKTEGTWLDRVHDKAGPHRFDDEPETPEAFMWLKQEQQQ